MRRRGLHHSGHGKRRVLFFFFFAGKKRRKQWNVKRTGRLQEGKNTHTHTHIWKKKEKKDQGRQDRAGCRVTSPVTCPGCRVTHHPRSGQEISKRRRGGGVRNVFFLFWLPSSSQSLVQRSKPSSYMVLSSRKCGSMTSGRWRVSGPAQPCPALVYNRSAQAASPSGPARLIGIT